MEPWLEASDDLNERNSKVGKRPILVFSFQSSRARGHASTRRTTPQKPLFQGTDIRLTQLQNLDDYQQKKEKRKERKAETDLKPVNPFYPPLSSYSACSKRDTT